MGFYDMKKIISVFLGLLVVIVVGMFVYLYAAYPDVPAAQNITVKGTPAQIKRGKYLANHVSMCMDCHSTRDYTKFAGPVVPGTRGKGGEIFDKKEGFPGTFISKNITPYNLKNWTDGELFRTITTGVTKDNNVLFPVMPYLDFSNMDPRDVKAIIAYIRTLKPIEYKNKASKANFPMNLIMRTIPHQYNGGVRPAVKDTVAYGKYLVNIAACMDCHTPRKNGQPIKTMYMAGGMPFVMPSGTVRSANLTPDRATGLGSWTSNQFVAYFKQYDIPADSLPSPKQVGYNTVMPWTMYAGMKKQDLRAIFAYLQTLPPVKHVVKKFIPASKIARK